MRLEHSDPLPPPSLTRVSTNVQNKGEVERATEAESDEYWNSRPRGSQLASSASQQSREIHGSYRELLELAKEDLKIKYDGKEEIPRPSHFGGWKIRAKRIEFWKGALWKFHRRIRFERNDVWENEWNGVLLQP